MWMCWSHLWSPCAMNYLLILMIQKCNVFSGIHPGCPVGCEGQFWGGLQRIPQLGWDEKNNPWRSFINLEAVKPCGSILQWPLESAWRKTLFLWFRCVCVCHPHSKLLRPIWGNPQQMQPNMSLLFFIYMYDHPQSNRLIKTQPTPQFSQSLMT